MAMKIKKDGKTITLTESDLKMINKKVITEMYGDNMSVSVYDFIGNIVDELLGGMPNDERDGLIRDIMTDMKEMIYSYLHEY
jgi:hypothetical protein